jgi:hypothetical protein
MPPACAAGAALSGSADSLCCGSHAAGEIYGAEKTKRSKRGPAFREAGRTSAGRRRTAARRAAIAAFPARLSRGAADFARLAAAAEAIRAESSGVRAAVR